MYGTPVVAKDFQQPSPHSKLPTLSAGADKGSTPGVSSGRYLLMGYLY
jgi:hypothetical protein